MHSVRFTSGLQYNNAAVSKVDTRSKGSVDYVVYLEQSILT